ncbi:CCAAT/enhancer-binding protein zeta [Gastrophryne carolinensis]
MEDSMEPEDCESGDDVGGESKHRKAAEAGFTLDEVLKLGGTKHDFIMLASLQDVDGVIEGGRKGEIDDLEEGELQAFIEKLGIQKIAKEVLAQEDSAEETTEEKSKESVKEKKGEKNKKKDATDIPKETEKTTAKAVKKTELNSSSKPKAKHVFDFLERSMLLLKPGGKWFDHEYSKEYTSDPQNEEDVQKYRSLAEKLYEQEVNLYKNKKELQKGANAAWMKTVVSTGTLADRMAAMTVLLQDAPIHTVHFVENLINLVRKKGSKRQNIMALDTLKDLLMSDLLPENRKLNKFVHHPFDKIEVLSSGNRDARDRRLILWYFEEQLKQHIAEFVKVLEVLTHDNLIATKTKALNVIHELLCSKPEEEKTLLTLLVNKLGDPQYKVATKASYLLEVLLNKHPNMKVVVCLEVERLLYRPNISEKAQYYGVCFLNQIMFSREESDLANQLITVYFSFFRACIKKKEIDSKILRALLTGVNRAYPYSQIGNEKVKEQLDTLFKILHVVNFNTGVQILMLLFQVMDSQQTLSHRYYGALYRKLLDPGLSQGSKQTMFLNLLYKSLKADVALKRIKAFVKRLLQVTCFQKPAFICGALYLISEIIKIKPALKTLLNENGEIDEEEHFVDLPDDDDSENEGIGDGNREQNQSKDKGSSQMEQKGSNTFRHYDPINRNPLFCGADNTCLWELKQLSEHFHPSVALFAKTILEGNTIQYTGDPLQDFTMMRFLDRFVYRNPKQKLQEGNRFYVMHQKKKLYMNENKEPVNSSKFLEKEENEIPVDEVFFHRFFKKLSREKQRQKRHEDEESVEDVDDEEFEKILDFEGDSFYQEKSNDLDFAGSINPGKKTTKKKEAEEDSGSDWDSAAEDEDDDISLGSMCEEDFETGEAGVFMDTETVDDEPEPEAEPALDVFLSLMLVIDYSFTELRKGKKRRLKQENMFAAAEEFGDMLDDNSGSKFDNIGLNAMSNKENASVKQLRWEAERDNWVHNRDAKSIIKRKKQFKQKKSQKKGNKR